MKRHLILSLAVAVVTGCQAPSSMPSAATTDRSSAKSETHGIVKIRVTWPNQSSHHLQAIPLAARTVVLKLSNAAGDELLTRTLTRTDTASVTARLDVAPGDGYMIAAESFDASGALLATGRSEAFSIVRQRLSMVELTLEPRITRVTGTGVGGYSGDGGPAVSGQVFTPNGLAADRDGNLYIADYANFAIRRIDSSGMLSTVAGTNKLASAAPALGDNGLPTETAVSRPVAVAVAPNGDLFIANTTHSGVRIIPAETGERYGQSLKAGRLFTIVNGFSPPIPTAVAVDSSGNVFYSEAAQIQMLTPGGSRSVVGGTGANSRGQGVDGPATASSLNGPEGFVVDKSGNLLFVERGNHRVRLLCREPGTYYGIPMASGSVYTIAGNGSATTDPVMLGDGKDALDATLNFPRGLAFDSRGNLYIADQSNHRIRRLTPDRRISTLAGTGISTGTEGAVPGDGGSLLKATFANPIGLTVINDILYVADSGNHSVRRIPL